MHERRLATDAIGLSRDRPSEAWRVVGARFLLALGNKPR